MTEHPLLPCGYNADDNDGDEVDGAGTNWPIWPLLFDSFEGLTPLIITDGMLDAFETTCADYIVPGENNIGYVPVEDQVMFVRNAWRTIELPATSNLIVFPSAPPSVKLKSEPNTAALVPGDRTHAIAPASRTATIRRKG